MKEFRVVIDEKDISNFNLDASKAKDFTDYYLERSKRIRHFPINNKWFLIEVEPGTIEKNKKEILEQEAKKMTFGCNLIIEKKGIGIVDIEGIEGYMERVLVYHPGNNEPIINEVHIEFEEDFEKIPEIENKIRPLKIIKQGMFDYVSKVKI